MKTTLITLLATAALLTIGGTIQAQNATRNDGIAASPKHLQTFRTSPTAPAAVTPTKMACPGCKDVTVAHRDMTARGANKPMVTTTTHSCGGCQTRWALTGHGKTAERAVRHSCTMGETPACCNTGS